MHRQRGAHEEAERRKQALYRRVEADPFDIGAQRELEEEIQQAAVHESYARALEDNPELVAGSVHMLYVLAEANGVPVKAFVDSGAQMTIMSVAHATKCGIMRLVDKRMAGMAVGVGTQKIIGRVHSLQLKLGSSFLPCSLSVLESGPDFLFGLDSAHPSARLVRPSLTPVLAE